ncbi:MAG: aspartate aminotransferase [Rhodospirillales bacterium 69-11]|nr:pyridoxal phosphate-dependent aminotransferase [Rhodospirillales bacterium]OJW26402.1 MAG: aspartate aminotransferase [Rhodospirillales bacterium 69-11]
MTPQDIVRIPGSRIVEVARLAFATPDVDFLCFGESDQPSPASARQAAIAALEAGETRYPDVRGLPALRQALADYLTGLHARPVTESRIQLAASGMAAISIALAATVRAGDRVVLHGPAWPNVGNAARLRGATVEELDLTPQPDGSFRLDLERLDAMLDGARAFVLNSPNNPTGWTATTAELQAMLEIARRRGVWLISDEVYSRLVYDGSAAAPSLLDLAEPDDRVIVCNSFSKTWVMTGWRLGWLVVPDGTREIIADLVEVVHSGVAPFVQRAGLAAIEDTEVVERFRAHCATGRALASDALEGLNGVRYTAPRGAFYAFLGVEGLTDSLDLALKLVAKHGVAVAPGVAFGASGEGSLRVCFAQSPALMERAMQRLRDGLRAELR